MVQKCLVRSYELLLRPMNLDELQQDCLTLNTTLEDKIISILSRRFVKYEKVARVLAIALQSRQNVILWGPAGHGKSEMVEDVLKGLRLWETDIHTGLPLDTSNTFVQSFGEGMNEDQLWGGIDLRAMDDDKEIRYHPENSFLSREIAVFEEMFDAPAICLLPLKHTLTQKVLAKGGNYYAMQTKCIIVCTNKNPEDLQGMGPSHQALVERFPIQLKVEWDGYKPEDYQQMMLRHTAADKFSGEILGALADNISRVTMNGSFISPRTAMWAMQLVADNARARGATKVELQDFQVLEFLPGMESTISTLREDMERSRVVMDAKARMAEVKRKYNEIHTLHKSYLELTCTSPIKWLQLAKSYTAFTQLALQTTCTDDLMTIRDQMVEQASKGEKACMATAVTYTKESST